MLNILFVQEWPCIRNYKMATALRGKGHRVSLAYAKAKLSQMYVGLSDDLYDQCFQLKSHRHLWDISKRYDLIHCHNEPDQLTVTALAGDAPVVHDTHDLISLRENDSQITYYEGVANRGAAGRVYSTPYQMEKAKELYGVTGQSLVLYNYVSAADLPKRILPKLSAQDGETHIVYEGSISGASHRDFGLLFLALTKRGVHIHIYPAIYDQRVAQVFATCPTIYYNQPVSPKRIMEEMTQYDFGIIPFNLEKGNKEFLDTTIANKLFEYQVSGLPILTAPLKSYIEYFEHNPVGMTFTDDEDLISKLPALRDMEIDFSDRIYTYEGEIARLEEFYHAVIEDTSGSSESKQARRHWEHRGVFTCYFDEGKQSAAIVDTVKGFTGIKSVLEFGCNVGRNLHCLDRDIGGLDLAGIDINADAVRAGIDRYGLSLEVGGEERLQAIPDDTYDVVFTVSVLDHIPDMDGVLRELLRVAGEYLILLEPFNGTDSSAEEYATAEYSYFWNYPAALNRLGAVLISNKPCPLGGQGLEQFYRLYVIKKSKITSVCDAATWNALLKQSPYALYSHSAEYNLLVFDGRLNHFKISVGGEVFLVSLELQEGIAASFLKYYGGLIPVDTYEHITTAYDILCQTLRECNVRGLVLSYIQEPSHEFVDVLTRYIEQARGNSIEVPKWTHASIMFVDKSYEDVWDTVYSTKTRNMIRKAKKGGVECRTIDILDHVDDAVACTLSKPVRHGSRLPEYYYDTDMYRQKMERWQEIFGDNMISFGAFFDGKLVAYINTFVRFGEAITNNMLSHADALQVAPNNAVFDFMIKYYTDRDDVRRLMYSFDTTESVDKFKHSMGFEPILVKRWYMELNDQVVVRGDNYSSWIKAMVERGCNFLTADAILNDVGVVDDMPNVVIRHDVDCSPQNALVMARAEKALGAKSTFYIFAPDKYGDGFPVGQLQAFEKLGWEIGYHVNTDDLDEALADIAVLRESFDIRTTVPHMGTHSICDSDLKEHVKFLLAGQEFGVRDDGYIADNGSALQRRMGIVDGKSKWAFVRGADIISYIQEMQPGGIYHFSFHPCWYDGNLNFMVLTPMRRVMFYLKSRNIEVGRMRALEVFGHTGKMHVTDYHDFVASLDVWEIDPALQKDLAANLPGAAVSIVDSYEEIKKTDKRYGLVVIDNPMGMHDGHCEHFDFFPDVFGVLTDDSVLIMNVVPMADDQARRRYSLFGTEHLGLRTDFYGTDDPENISFEDMAEVYSKLALESGFVVEWSVTVQRSHIYYLVLKLTRKESQ